VSSDFGKPPVPGRLPRNYATILAALRQVEAGRHLTAHEVFVRARAVQPQIGFATVHRGLARLGELGLVTKLDVPGATSTVYECAAEPHAHFRCRTCGAIEDVAFAVPPALLASLAERHGVEIAGESTTFAGRCARCMPSGPAKRL
jgi:Fe2+ or Zn2+ uptake regulation protein